MEFFELTLILALYALALALLGRRFGIIDPIMLVMGGLLLSFLPFATDFKIDPHFVLTIFLPPVLYYAALDLSWRELSENLHSILLLAVGLVLVTALAVAGVAHLLIPGFPLVAGMVLGAIVSPPDAVAATSVLSKLRVPRRLVTVLEGESLINDATALVLYSFAVTAALEGHFSLPEAVVGFASVSTGGIALGLVLGQVSLFVHGRLKDPLLEMMLSLTVPFLTFITAEHFGVSGVLAVVTAGILRSSQSPRRFSAESRLQMRNMWRIIVFVLNAIGFLIIGVQMRTVLGQLHGSFSPLEMAVYGFVVCAVVILVRLLWVYPAAWLLRVISAHVRQHSPMPPKEHLAVIGWSGMRGIVSLVAALALPEFSATYMPFPGHDMILFLTYCVILVTLVGQGGTLGWLIRHLGVEAVSCDPTHGRTARARLREAGLDTIGLNEAGRSPTAVSRARQHYEQMLSRLRTPDSTDELENLIATDSNDYHDLAMQALQAERRALGFMHKNREVDDELFRELMEELDLHEILVGRERVEG